MRVLIAGLFKLLFRFRFFRKRYYGIVFHIFQPLNLFRGVTRVTGYDRDLRMKLDLDEWIQQHIYFLGYFDHYGILFLKKNLKEGDVFIDAGANVGSYTLVAAKMVGKTGKVFSFEPAENIFNRLKENIELNGHENIIAEQKALFDKNSELEFYPAAKSNLGMSSIYHHDAENGRVEKVEAVSLDDYFENHGTERLDLVKIDIEGAELYALKGMQKSIGKYKPKILVELKEETLDRPGQSVNDIIDFLNEAGYQKFIIDEQGNISNDFQKKPEDYHNYLFIHNFK